MPGVAKVITWKDVKGKNAITGLITFPTNKGDGWDRPILCKEKVFQFGDAIAIVAADTVEHARAAADKVKVDLEVLPAYMSGFAALAPDAMEIHPGVPNVYYEQGVVKGADTKPLFDKAKATVDITTYCSRQPHLHLEPDCGVAYIDDDGVLTIQSKSIGVHLHHAMICPGIGVAPEKLQADPEPGGRHVRLQVLADHGGAARRRRARDRQAGVAGLQPVPEHHLHRQTLARQRQHPARLRRSKASSPRWRPTGGSTTGRIPSSATC